MRKYLYIFVLMLLVSVFMVNCTGSSGNMVYSDPSQTIEIQSGKQFDIKLEGNATTGYEWVPSFDESYIKLVNQEYKVESDPGRVGAPGEQYFTFKALKQGNTEISIVYKRSWEEGSADKKVFKVNIK